MIKFSVIITTYNSARFIERTLGAVLNQDGAGEAFELEILVVDDCSTDDTVNLLKKMDVIVLSTEKNSGGPNRGRNIGLDKATGDYLCIMDHDDIWHKDKLMKTLPHTQKAPIITSGYTLHDSSTDKNIARVSKGTIREFGKNETFLQKLSKSITGQITYMGSIVYHRSLKQIKFEEHFGMVDFDWILRLFYQNPSIEICESLYTRYVDGANLSLDEAYRRRDFYYSLMTIEEYQDQYTGEARIGYKKIHGSRARYYYLKGEMRKARFYFRRSDWSLKTLAYYLTTYVGAKWVKKKFNVFG
jgi:glycosyltransferase involved in cell wall biosynthesis